MSSSLNRPARALLERSSAGWPVSPEAGRTRLWRGTGAWPWPDQAAPVCAGPDPRRVGLFGGITLLLLVLLLPGTAAARSYLDSEGQPLSFDSEEQLLEFLRNAPVVWQKELPSSSNRPLKVRLEADGHSLHAVFRTVDVRRHEVQVSGRTFRDYHDSYLFECAAYRLSRVLGLDHVPPCVRRRLDDKDGTLQLWVEQARTEGGRRESGEKAPRPLDWMRQRQTMYLFDLLIFNFDRNQGNLLVTADWKLWFIDHTRSFPTSTETPGIGRLVWCERDLWQRLRDLSMSTLRKQLEPLVERPRLRALLSRRKRLIAHLQARIDEFGEEAVLYDPESDGPHDPRVKKEPADLPDTAPVVTDPGGG